MAEILVLYLSDDHRAAERLVGLLRARWTVWWAPDLAHGDWEEAVRAEIPRCTLVLPVLSDVARGDRKAIIKDEMRLARTQGKPILPFLLGPAEMPMGFGDLNRTVAYGWNGDAADTRFQELVSKVATVLEERNNPGLRRPITLKIGEKVLRLPSFIFSVSSFETRLAPQDGLSLLRGLVPGAALVSAYDAARYGGTSARSRFNREFRRLRDTSSVVVLDSGNYEASRKHDYYSVKRNPAGWRRMHYRDVVRRCVPDIAFHFDAVDSRGSAKAVARQIIRNFVSDERALRGTAVTLCPIVHVPVSQRMRPSVAAATIVREVAAELNPSIIAIPERELGEGLRQRFATVKRIREALDSLGRYYPLHLLGTGNPLSMAAFAVAGADLFDGLEWCRTVADYRTGALYHFQQFDMVGEACLGRIRDERIRTIARNPDVPYTTRALAYNVDFFEDWARTMRDLVHSAQQEALLRMIPDIGPALYEQFSKQEAAVRES